MRSSRPIFLVNQPTGTDWHGIILVGATNLDLFLTLSFKRDDRIVIQIICKLNGVGIFSDW